MIQRELYWWYSDMEGNKLKQVILIKKKSLIFLPKGKSPQTSLPLHHLVLQRVFLNCSLAFEKKNYSNTLCISENELISRHGKKKLEHVTEPDAATKAKHMRSKMARCEHIFE